MVSNLPIGFNVFRIFFWTYVGDVSGGDVYHIACIYSDRSIFDAGWGKDNNNNNSQVEQQQQVAPKLEDFLNINNQHFSYTADVSQTETQDSSSLTNIYDGTNSGVYYSEQQQDLKTMTGFPTFSTNSGSEVDDSVTQMTTTTTTQFAESGTDLSYSHQGTMNALSLGIVVGAVSNDKAIVTVDSTSQNSCKKISDTFGQRTSIYRGVTRYHYHYILFFFQL